MSASACRLAGAAFTAVLAASFAAPASADLLAHKDLSLDTAVTIATTAAATCKAQGYRVSVHVVGRNGEVLVALRGDNASPHTMENSMRKAYTSRTFRIPSGEMVKRLKENPQLAGDLPHQCHRDPGRAADHDRRRRHRGGRRVGRAGRRQGRGLRQDRHRQGRRPAEIGSRFAHRPPRRPSGGENPIRHAREIHRHEVLVTPAGRACGAAGRDAGACARLSRSADPADRADRGRQRDRRHHAGGRERARARGSASS